MAITIVNIAPHTVEWYEFRQREGIGGSEVGAIMGLDKYKCAQEVWGTKVGIYPRESIENEPMYWGRALEDLILHNWQYYDGRKNSYIENMRLGRKIRRFEKVEGIMVNDEFPWLYANVDAQIPAGMMKLSQGGGKLTVNGILEAKTIKGWVANQWDAGLPPTYAVQLQQYMVVGNADYGEFAVLMDGSIYDVFYVERSEELCEQICEISYDFWHNYVLPARNLWKENEALLEKGKDQLAAIKQKGIYDLEPAPDNSEAYKEFLKKRYREMGGEVTGDQQQYKMVMQAMWYKEYLEGVEKLKLECENKIKYWIGNKSLITFGKAGNVSWRENDRGRSFRYNIKDKVNKASVISALSKLEA